MTAVLETINLTKDYGANRALDGFTLSIKEGEVVGLLGPNGSGKTTALRTILGFLKPTMGSAKVMGFDCVTQSVDVRKNVAYLPGELRLYDSMTGRGIIEFLSKLRGNVLTQDVDALAKQLDIDLSTPLTRLSSGMKRKVALIAVLVPNVPLIILDEPTNTLDPTMRDQLLEQIQQAKRRGKAVLFSSHVLQEVEAVCDRVVILKKGKQVFEQELNELANGRQVKLEVIGALPVNGPDGLQLPQDVIKGQRLDLLYTGPMNELFRWLEGLEYRDLRIEPQGLTPAYRALHGGNEI